MMTRAIIIFGVATLIVVLAFGEPLYYSFQGYYVAHGFEDAHQLANSILRKDLSADECLSIKYIKGRILPDYLTDATMRDECLEDIAEARSDPMACALMQGPGSRGCLLDMKDRVVNEHQLPIPYYLCGFDEKTKIVNCHSNVWYAPENSEVPSQSFSIDSCAKFSHIQGREWCKQYHAVFTKNFAMCDQLTIPFIKEDCYLHLDTSCKKSTIPLMQKICEALNTMSLEPENRTLILY